MDGPKQTSTLIAAIIFFFQYFQLADMDYIKHPQHSLTHFLPHLFPFFEIANAAPFPPPPPRFNQPSASIIPRTSFHSPPSLLSFLLLLLFLLASSSHHPPLLIQPLHLGLAFRADGVADVVPKGGVELGVVALFCAGTERGRLVF